MPRGLVYDCYHLKEDKGSVNIFMATCPFFLSLSDDLWVLATEVNAGDASACSKLWQPFFCGLPPPTETKMAKKKNCWPAWVNLFVIEKFSLLHAKRYSTCKFENARGEFTILPFYTKWLMWLCIRGLKTIIIPTHKSVTIIFSSPSSNQKSGFHLDLVGVAN